jgi:hypothetical protein
MVTERNAADEWVFNTMKMVPAQWSGGHSGSRLGVRSKWDNAGEWLLTGEGEAESFSPDGDDTPCDLLKWPSVRGRSADRVLPASGQKPRPESSSATCIVCHLPSYLTYTFGCNLKQIYIRPQPVSTGFFIGLQSAVRLSRGDCFPLPACKPGNFHGGRPAGNPCSSGIRR